MHKKDSLENKQRFQCLTWKCPQDDSLELASAFRIYVASAINLLPAQHCAELTTELVATTLIRATCNPETARCKCCSSSKRCAEQEIALS